VIYRPLSLVVIAFGCGGGGGGGGGGSHVDAPAISSDCQTDALRTGLVAQQTGVAIDTFDCAILTAAAKYGEPDPMIFKAIIYVESRFDDLSVACPNLPCGTPRGWTAAESGCFGLMQVVPACGPTPDDEGLQSNGQPDLEMDSSASDWASSIFNPAINIDDGVSGVAANRTQEMAKFSGCTTDQYTLMAVGDYNSYGSTQSCTVYNTAYDDPMLDAYYMYATAAGYPAHAYR
jgi:Transglycosylase SLT domain